MVRKYVVVRERAVHYLEYYEVEAAEPFEAARNTRPVPDRATLLSSHRTFESALVEGGLWTPKVMEIIRRYERRRKGLG